MSFSCCQLLDSILQPMWGQPIAFTSKSQSLVFYIWHICHNALKRAFVSKVWHLKKHSHEKSFFSNLKKSGFDWPANLSFLHFPSSFPPPPRLPPPFVEPHWSPSSGESSGSKGRSRKPRTWLALNKSEWWSGEIILLGNNNEHKNNRQMNLR